VLGWPKRCKLAHVFLWECSDNGLKLAQLLAQLGVFLSRAMCARWRDVSYCKHRVCYPLHARRPRIVKANALT
jgi:hypothetical protein